MKRLGMMSLALALLASTACYAQEMSPADKGNTGWTGGSRDQPSQSGQGPGSETTGRAPASNPAHDAEAAKDQPWMASGEDLKGPPQQFPPSKTPE